MVDGISVGSGGVKSAMRVLEVLEYISEKKSSLTVKEVSEGLGYPQSSTSGLLRTLATSGYLTQDTQTQRYSPTVRVMLMGAWMQEKIFQETSILSVMEDLKAETGCAVLLGMKHGTNVRFIYIMPSERRNGYVFPKGTIFPILKSVTGRLLLSAEKDDEVLRVIESAEAAEGLEKVARTFFDIKKIREDGWYDESDNPGKNMCGISILLPKVDSHPQMALTLGYYCHQGGSEWQRKKFPLLESLRRASLRFDREA